MFRKIKVLLILNLFIQFSEIPYYVFYIFGAMLETGERLIGRFTGEKRGPLLICLAGVHGNEQAGIRALELIFKMLEVEPITNPSFEFFGRIVGFKGNLEAIKQGRRYIREDMNRMWIPSTIRRVMRQPFEWLEDEEKELRELLRACHLEMENFDPPQIVVLDLHTTSCEGGIFSIVSEELHSIELGIELHAPVIRGMNEGLEGTTLHYFHPNNFIRPVTGISFESGQHDNPLSINRAIAGIINCMRTIGCVRAEHVENQHDSLLIEHSKDLPKVAQLIYSHRIQPGDEFRMLPGFTNFDYVKKGDLLAEDRHGMITARCDGHLLMPLYQEQGSDGFFMVEQHDPSTLPPRLTFEKLYALPT